MRGSGARWDGVPSARPPAAAEGAACLLLFSPGAAMGAGLGSEGGMILAMLGTGLGESQHD